MGTYRSKSLAEVIAGVAPPAVDPLPVLTRLLAAGCEHHRGPCDDKHCFYCDAWLDMDPHAHDCPYVEAITLFGDPHRPGPAGVMKA